MNFLSYLILAVILVLFVFAARSAFFSRTGRKGGCCDSCSQENCALRNVPRGKHNYKRLKTQKSKNGCCD